LGLINGILDISRIEANRMELKPQTFNLRMLLGECVTLLKHQFDAKELAISVSVQPSVPDVLVGDAQKLRQILFNLLSNACKYTLEGGVSLSVENFEMNGDLLSPVTGIRIHVDDTGVGIAEEFQRIIFDDFTRLVGRPDLPPGTGLGLAITARLCRLMGGTISLTSTMDKGTRFTLELPFTLPERIHGAEPLRYQGDSSQEQSGVHPSSRILVAEDNAVNSRLMAMMLGKLGLSAEFVTDGQAALERVQAGGVDLVFMDLEMPIMDGLEAARRIRQQSPFTPYIIALTAYSFDAQRQDCMQVGMNDFITKPLRLAELRSALQRFQKSSNGPFSVVR
jgi:CheY-like chemotaxis protein